jgi:hypothetical protein
LQAFEAALRRLSRFVGGIGYWWRWLGQAWTHVKPVFIRGQKGQTRSGSIFRACLPSRHSLRSKEKVFVKRGCDGFTRRRDPVCQFNNWQSSVFRVYLSPNDLTSFIIIQMVCQVVVVELANPGVFHGEVTPLSSWTPTRANKVCYPCIPCHRWFQNL